MTVLEWFVVLKLSQTAPEGLMRGPHAESIHPRPASVATDTNKQIPMSALASRRRASGCILWPG
jgi:hypothetical protein